MKREQKARSSKILIDQRQRTVFKKFETERTVQNINSKSNHPSQLLLFKGELDRDYFHWGATVETMEIIRRRGKSPETLKLVEKWLEISRPRTIRR